jgi:hypothetical protein
MKDTPDKISSKPKRIAKWIGLGIVTLLVAYSILVLAAKLEWGGSSPNRQLVGKAEHQVQLQMAQFCTGVTRTPQNTWLVSRSDSGRPDSTEIPSSAIDLRTVSPRKNSDSGDDSTALDGDGDGESPFMVGREFSVISRLTPQGVFETVAILPEVACLVATPNGNSVFLLSGWELPDAQSGAQTAVFRSDDQGRSWSVVPDGWFPEANWIAWTLAPRFHGDDEVWVTGKEDSGLRPAIFYSPDRGKTADRVALSPAFEIHDAELAKLIPAGAETLASEAEIKAFALQVNDNQALVWMSKSKLYREDGHELNGIAAVTAFMPLNRVGGQWRDGTVTKLSAMELHNVELGPDGKVFAVLEHHRDGEFTRPVIAKFDPVTFAWHEQGNIPSPFSPMNASTYIRSFHASNRVLLLNVSYDHDVPRWLYPWKEASVSANANYYSVNEGRSWSKLDVPGYLGLAGFDPSRDTIYRIGENASFGNREVESLRLE